ncbi:endo-1,4-beta-xylanase [Xanthomonas hortorum pv. pelargonii]|uniref:Beta-xylanase n=6 Tax=Xanthomonas hortorum TaxID=56454 RepID=A0A6V7F6A0_9XANT|nr:endo-1,4-beta-xylanase [Xanthomonas hortorum]MCE4353084.1 endo-1,4-beta-xylanase [Xanthomonas hortorum pv. pelargonii]MCM5522994.1 endo-1,4-beta-xylanase [Xanthomonas hortorum pv. pelargonii]MCM5535007.1 endo-1,4-beta-xylanase [Xanthomonas hortorum pv. pelargonii]MCM5539237.1 endo-1,4-beta-xylanase [Xanthomonas hortorum pv. pelargonii]MCM5543153.1 endo-1,4-beta-xylanase [Xanthomonas hortorum pv. pelargonii]
MQYNPKGPATRLRFGLALIGALMALPAIAVCDTRSTSLKHAYADGFLIGTAVNTDIVSGKDAVSAALVACHFNAITAENVMKAEVVAPRPGVFDFSAADAFVAYGRSRDMFVIGHTLVWHNQTPDWFFVDAQGNPNTADAQLERMRAHIERVAGRYAGKVQAWDVVNEIIDEDGSYRATNWVQRVGDGDTVVRNAFTFAQRYAPDAQLYYNDFNAWRPAKRDGIVRMVKMLQHSGIRIDGVGMQGHWGLDYPSLRDIEDAIDAYAALGIKVMITELDIDVLPLTKEGQVIGTGLAHKQFQLPEFKRFLDPYRDGLPPEVQAQLRDRYAELFALFWRKRDKLARVSVWGVTDGMSWKNDYPVPGRTNYPLLFDRKHQPKPALDAVLAVPADSSAR